ncbi:MAG TPA: cyclase family protein [Asanoa sp.]|jgi:kynurenine formamidase|nr:cyclase family protein [Asanoa sp.]
MTLPTEAEVLSWFETLSNWGRWGPDDRLGTLNLITAETRVAAARLVQEGHVVSLAWDVDTAPQRDQTYGPPRRFFVTTGQGLADEHRVDPHGNPDNRMNGALEYLGYVFHGYSVTHLDALSHVFWDRKMYNGVPAELVSSSHGATAHDVTAVKGGVITRGILVDVAAFRGVDWLEPGDPVTATEVRAVLAAQGSEVREGDALLLRTGYGKRRALRGPDDVRALGRAGWHASCAPLFHELGVALIGADTAQDVVPSGYDSVVIPVHTLGLVAMGLYMIDNMNLEELSAKCASAGRHTFELVVSTIPFLGATGSPVNPLAVF